MKNSLALMIFLGASLWLTNAMGQTAAQKEVKTADSWVQQMESSLGTTFGDLSGRQIGPGGGQEQGQAQEEDDSDEADDTEIAGGEQAQGDGDSDRADGTQVAGGVGGSTDNGDAVGDGGTGTGITGAGITDPAAVNPADPDIAGFIGQWINSAEPPINAKGAKARYTEWGSLEGQLIGARTVNVGRPDAAAGMTPAAYVWGIRRQLDSINHCNLEEYVMAQLARDNIAKCRGRFETAVQVSVANMVGRPGAEAKKALEKLGLKVSLTMGKPATSAAQAFTVVRQDQDGEVAPGTRVKLTVYDAFKAPVRVPSIAGLPGTAARSQLIAAGFQVEVASVGDAPDAAQAFTVRDTSPRALTEAARGSLVVINTYGAFDDSIIMPNVIGMDRRAARQKLEGLGININSKESGEAPREQQQYIVTAQSPAQGVKIKPRTRAEFTHYGRYIWHMTMPDLRGMTQNQVRARFGDGKIRLSAKWGDMAPSSRQSETVARQNIAAGTRVTEGASLNLVYYRKSKDQQLAAFNCSIPNSVRYWNAGKGAPACQCRSGYNPSQDGKNCVKPKSRAQLVAEYRCSIPNSQAYWNNSASAPGCQCRRGFSASRDGRNCVAPPPPPKPPIARGNVNCRKMYRDTLRVMQSEVDGEKFDEINAMSATVVKNCPVSEVQRTIGEFVAMAWDSDAYRRVDIDQFLRDRGLHPDGNRPRPPKPTPPKPRGGNSGNYKPPPAKNCLYGVIGPDCDF